MKQPSKEEFYKKFTKEVAVKIRDWCDSKKLDKVDIFCEFKENKLKFIIREISPKKEIKKIK